MHFLCIFLVTFIYTTGCLCARETLNMRLLKVVKGSPLIKVTSSPKKVTMQLEGKISRPQRPPEAS